MSAVAVASVASELRRVHEERIGLAVAAMLDGVQVVFAEEQSEGTRQYVWYRGGDFRRRQVVLSADLEETFRQLVTLARQEFVRQLQERLADKGGAW